jgi:curved DNA-binding protein CbpA
VSARDPYEVLGVPRSASIRQIRLAYLDRARKAHPDLVGHRGTEVMQVLNEAWATLKDPERRSALDASAAPAGSGSPVSERSNASDGTKPFWTGAAGPPPGRPSGSVVDFGIFAGWSLGEIARRDRGYLVWLRDRPDGKRYREEIDRLVDPGTDEGVAQARRRRR